MVRSDSLLHQLPGGGVHHVDTCLFSFWLAGGVLRAEVGWLAVVIVLIQLL